MRIAFLNPELDDRDAPDKGYRSNCMPKTTQQIQARGREVYEGSPGVGA
jgi:hypothetical protein